MGLTKIINILKEDRFEDVLDTFKKAQAEEVIFIFPKNTKLARKEEYFASLAKEAENAQKQITVVTADQNIERYAEKYGFRFLSQQSKTKRPRAEHPAVEIEPALLALAKAKGHRAKRPEQLRHGDDKNIQKLESIWLKREALEKVFKKSAPPSIGKNFNLIFLSSAVAVLLIVLFVFLGSAQVILKPQKQKLDFELPVAVSTNVAETDASINRIPGQFLSFKADASKDFPATGEEEVVKKARGEITVFNNFNSDPQNLVATTRFESSKGLIFRIPRPITVPGARVLNGQLTPGSITVEVMADKPGPEYNINADRFTVPGFSGTPKFEGFYAESAKPMSGGTVGLSKIVTEQDFNYAKETVTKEALEKSLTGLKAKTNNLEIIDPVKNELSSLKSTSEIDDSAEGFAISVAAEAKTIGFYKDDLSKIIEEFINKNDSLVLLKETTSLDYKNVKFDFENKNLTFTVIVKGEAAAKINEDKIIDGLLGLKENKVKDYLLGFKEIESARVALSPFWIKTIPKNKKDIHLKVVY